MPRYPIISGSIPTLLEYQKQIEAHTANILKETMRIARSNEAILARLNDVIAIGDYGEGIKVIS